MDLPEKHHKRKEMRKKGLSRRLVPTPDGKQKYSVFVIYFIFFFFSFACVNIVFCALLLLFSMRDFKQRILVGGFEFRVGTEK